MNNRTSYHLFIWTKYYFENVVILLSQIEREIADDYLPDDHNYLTQCIHDTLYSYRAMQQQVKSLKASL